MTFQLKLTLHGVRPPVWRRVLVPATLRMDALHTVIQVAMGWSDSHQHSFTRAGNCWTVVDPQPYTVSLDLDERKFRLEEVLARPNENLLYVYDFRDNWRHKVTLEDILPGHQPPTCVAGKGDCPREESRFDPQEDEWDPDDAYRFSVSSAAAALSLEDWPPGSLG